MSKMSRTIYSYPFRLLNIVSPSQGEIERSNKRSNPPASGASPAESYDNTINWNSIVVYENSLRAISINCTGCLFLLTWAEKSWSSSGKWRSVIHPAFSVVSGQKLYGVSDASPWYNSQPILKSFLRRSPEMRLSLCTKAGFRCRMSVCPSSSSEVHEITMTPGLEEGRWHIHFVTSEHECGCIDSCIMGWEVSKDGFETQQIIYELGIVNASLMQRHGSL